MLLKNETACCSPLTRGRGWPVAVEFQKFREVNAGDVFIARALEVPRSGWRWAGGQVKWWREGGGGEEDMRGQPIKKDSLPFFLFLRGKKRIGVKSGGGRGRGGKEEERGGGRTPIQGSTRPVGMECRYKSSPRLHPRLLASWPVPSFRPSLSLSLLSFRLHRTLLLLLLRLSSASTADRDVAHRIITVFYLSTGFTIYYYTVRACWTTTTRRYRSALLLLLPPLLSNAAAAAVAAITTISLLFADVLFILLLTPINLDYYVSIWIM